MGIIKQHINKIAVIFDRRIYQNKNFVVISNNCWGAEIYKRLGIKYNTPFVGLFIFGPDYLKLLSNFDHFINLELNFKQESKWIKNTKQYPIGYLDDIEIHFLHYVNNDEAKSKWTKRLKRMNEIKDKDHFYFKICDREHATNDIIIKFHDLLDTPFRFVPVISE
ncbi:DUF1919 domain-containing protein [Aquimarina agarilytica]|uniref:DUF1919 domain-containing protein n=1 Tax=Aquimarina agarilytica TaxID=1087449 RepID=UPI000289F013|nr:DUF1919 domain-containing protein [Aquimarina agarilytica]